MLSITQLVGIAALASTSLVSRVAADAVPTSPGPGDSFNVSTCISRVFLVPEHEHALIPLSNFFLAFDSPSVQEGSP